MEKSKEKTPFSNEFKNNYGAATTNPGNQNASTSGGAALASPTSPMPFFIRSRGLAELRQHCHRQMRDEGIDEKARKKLIIASILCLVFMCIEVVGGILSNSLAIATDAAHLLTDFASFMISLFALWLAARPSTQRMSFGWYRAEVIGALVSVFMIWVITGVLVYLAAQRVITGVYEVNAKIMLITSATAIAFNVFMGITLCHGGHGHTHFGGMSHGHTHGHSHGADGGCCCGGHNPICGHCQISISGQRGDDNCADNCSQEGIQSTPFGYSKQQRVQPQHEQQQTQHRETAIVLATSVSDEANAFNAEHDVGQCYNDTISINYTSTSQSNKNYPQILHTEYITQHIATPAPILQQVGPEQQLREVCGGSVHTVFSTRGENGQIKERVYTEMHHENINVRAAFIHVIGDVLQSVGVFMAALVIFVNPKWAIADPICTFLFSVIVLFTTFAILKDTLMVLMEATPAYIEYDEIAKTLKEIENVRQVHSLRIWALSVNKVAICAHLAVEIGADTRRILEEATTALHQKYNFFETTIQVEDFSPEMETCRQCVLPLC